MARASTPRSAGVARVDRAPSARAVSARVAAVANAFAANSSVVGASERLKHKTVGEKTCVDAEPRRVVSPSAAVAASAAVAVEAAERAVARRSVSSEVVGTSA